MVHYEKEQSVALITFQRSDFEAYSGLQRVSELNCVRDRVCQDADIRVIVIGGTEIFSDGSEAESASLPDYKDSIASIVGGFENITIASVSGESFGLGLEMALTCDLRLCAETACFSMDHIAYGIMPSNGGTQRLSRVIGQAKAMEMILTGELIDAQEAYRIGLVTKVVSPKELMPATMEMAREMASKGPIALRYAKEAVYKGMDLTLEQGLRLEADLYFLLHTTKHRTEGIRAFQEKRPPRFEGR